MRGFGNQVFVHCTVCDKKVGRRLGTRLAEGMIPLSLCMHTNGNIAMRIRNMVSGMAHSIAATADFVQGWDNNLHWLSQAEIVRI